MIQRTHIATESLHGFLRTHLLGLNPRADAPELYRLLRFIIVLMLICTAVMLYVAPASEILVVRSRIHQLHNEKTRLERENARLVQEIASYSNLDYIEGHARRMGYGPVFDNQELTLYVEPANAPVVVSNAPSVTVTSMDENWWLVVQRWSDEVLERVTPHALAARQ